ncbi:hypothetical protein [Parasitella parasitica]|uniref:BHLH domain-containing protein n=1 Tax=Parasitella parasitica TaxID=35722 RepID=A0A0B7NAN5_9FUNG|nr:hypothetical protein [Parasitella parasitica]
MEYDPKVSTHKASSITSTTSASSNSTWESNHPQFSLMDNDHLIIQNDDYISERISLHDVTTVHSSLGNTMKTMKTEYHEQCNANMEHEQEPRDDQLDCRAQDRNVYLQPLYSQGPIYLQHGDQITKNYHLPRTQQECKNSALMHVPESDSTLASTRQRSSSILSLDANCNSVAKRQKPNNRDILTDDEKRVNHIASEQKRRNTIRLGFKELTDIIPTLKNINNSKSTILFKAVEYIKHLDKRNRGLRDKLSTLQIRMNVQGRMILQQQHHNHRQQQPQRKYSSCQQRPSGVDSHRFSHLPANAVSALLAHKNQQKQLEALQEQLRLQQQLLAKHNILPEYLTSPAFPSTLPPSKPLFSDQLLLSSIHKYNSISIPSSTSSNSDENDDCN